MAELAIVAGMGETDVDPRRIEQARAVIDPTFLDSPQYSDPMLDRELGRRVIVKLETANPLRSFKGRGAQNLLHTLGETGPLVSVSMGNWGQAMAYAATRTGLSVTLFVPATLAPGKLRRMAELGATLREVPGDSAAAAAAARAFVAERPGHRLVLDGKEVAVAEGAGTIGLELLAEQPDTVVLPVGDGALAAGVAAAMKRQAPGVRIVGVCAAGAPSMALSWRRRERVTTSAVDTIAQAVAIREPIAESLPRLYALVDDMVLVDDAAIGDAVELAARTLGVLLEPAGATGLAAIATRAIPGERVAVILTGANPG